jgi:hypothetical protein
VEIWRAETEVVSVKTGHDGKFAIEHLDAGHYDIRARAPGFHAVSFHIIVVKPKTSDKRMLHIELVAWDGCGRIHTINSM